MPLPNPSMSFTPFDTLPASDLNDLAENIEALQDGSAFDSNSIDADFLLDDSVEGSKLDFADFADYSTSEYNTGIKWVDGSSIYRKTISTSTLPNNAQQSTAHGITGITRVIDITGIAWRSSDNTALPLPFSSRTSIGDSIEIYLQGANVVISTSSNRSTYSGHITVFYLK